MRRWASSWLFRKGEDPAPAPVPEEKVDRALEDLDKDRAPTPVSPGGLPGEPQQPMSATEVMGQLEASGKAFLDAGLDVEKAAVSLQKIKTMSGTTESDREVLAKAEAFLSQAAEAKEMVANLASAVSEYRKSLSAGKASSWL